MPIYEYYCDKCDITFTEFDRKARPKKKIKCLNCRGWAKRIYSSFSARKEFIKGIDTEMCFGKKLNTVKEIDEECKRLGAYIPTVSEMKKIRDLKPKKEKLNIEEIKSVLEQVK